MRHFQSLAHSTTIALQSRIQNSCASPSQIAPPPRHPPSIHTWHPPPGSKTPSDSPPEFFAISPASTPPSPCPPQRTRPQKIDTAPCTSSSPAQADTDCPRTPSSAPAASPDSKPEADPQSELR